MGDPAIKSGASAHRLRRALSIVPPTSNPAPTTPPATEPKPQSDIDRILATATVRGSSVKDQVLRIDDKQGDLRRQIDAVKGSISQIEKTQTDLEKAVADKKAKLAVLEARGGLLDTVKAKYEAEIAKDEIVLGNLEAKLTTLRAESTKLESAAKQLSTAHRMDYSEARNARNYLAYLKANDPSLITPEVRKAAEDEAKSEASAQAESRLEKGEGALAENRDSRRNNAKATGTVMVDVAATTRTIDQEREALQVTTRELVDVKSQSSDLKDRTKAQLDEIALNQGALDAAHSRIGGLGDRIKDLENRRKMLIDSAIRGDIKDINEINRRLDALDKSATKLKEQVKDAQKDLDEAIARRQILDAGKGELEQEIAELQNRLSKLKADKKLGEFDLSSASRDLSGAKEDVRQMGAKDQLLVRHENGLSGERFDLLKEQEALEALAKLPDSKLAPADRERLKNRQDVSGKIGDLSRSIAEANAKRDQLASELKKREGDIDKAKGRINIAKTRLDGIETDLSENKTATEITAKDLIETEAELRSATKAITTALDDQKAIRSAMNKLEAEQEALRKKKEELEKNVNDLKKLQR